GEDGQAGIPLGVAVQDVERLVGRPVVDRDDLQLAQRLVEHGVQAGGEVLRDVVDRHHDAEHGGCRRGIGVLRRRGPGLRGAGGGRRWAAAGGGRGGAAGGRGGGGGPAGGARRAAAGGGGGALTSGPVGGGGWPGGGGGWEERGEPGGVDEHGCSSRLGSTSL